MKKLQLRLLSTLFFIGFSALFIKDVLIPTHNEKLHLFFLRIEDVSLMLFLALLFINYIVLSVFYHKEKNAS